MAIADNNSVAGTEVKVNLSMTPIDGNTLESVEWEAVVFLENSMTGKTLVIKKANAKKVDADNYIIPIDSSILGAGRYYITLVAKIPDADFPDGIRTEKKTVYTGVTINAR
jgi:hypothetical protein